MAIPEGFIPETTPPPGFVRDDPTQQTVRIPGIAQALAESATPENIRAARVVGTGAIAGAADVAEMGQRLPINAKSVAEHIKNVYRMLTGQELSPEAESAIAPKTAEQGFERVGLPANPAKEAKRLNVPYDDQTAMGRAVKSVTQAARFGTAAALTGAGPVASGISAIGAGAGQAIGSELGAGDIGAIVGGSVLPLTALRSGRAPLTTVEEVRNLKNAAYARSEAAGIVLDPNSMTRLASDVRRDLAGELGRAELHPQANAALRFIEDQASIGLPITLKGMDLMRQTVKGTLYTKAGAPRMDVSDSDARLVERIIDRIDAFQGSLIPGSRDVIMGDAAIGGPALMEARQLNTRYRKAETIQDLVSRADTRAQAPDLAIRNEFATLARSSRFDMFTPQEQAAIMKMVQGGPITQTLRTLGRVAPVGARSGLFGVLHGMGILGSHYASHNPEAMTYAVTAALTTELAKRMSIGLARRNARDVVGLMAHGYRPPASIDLRPLVPAIEEGLQQRE